MPGILILGADDCVREVLAGYVEMLGFEAVVDPGLLPGVEAAAALIDLEEGWAEGFQWVERLCRDGVPVLVLSSGLEAATHARLRELGVRAVLGKPVGLETLTNALRRVVEGGK